MTIAGILRDRISAPPPAADHVPNADSRANEKRRSAEVRAVLDVLRLLVTAEHDELSSVAAVELGELLAVEAPDQFDRTSAGVRDLRIACVPHEGLLIAVPAVETCAAADHAGIDQAGWSRSARSNRPVHPTLPCFVQRYATRAPDSPLALLADGRSEV